MLWLFMALTLAPGRYAGEAPDGRVWLWLHADGRAEFGGADYAWQISDGVLHLAGDAPLSLKIVRGPCLVGPPLGRVCLKAAPLPTPSVVVVKRAQPPLLIGAWRHDATGGSLVLQLDADGRYNMRQAVLGDPDDRTRGRWYGDAETLTLVPDGGGPLTYRARRAGPDLFVGGGDLPFEVRLAAIRSGSR